MQAGRFVEPVQAGVATKGEERDALPARLLVKRSVRRIAIQTFSAHFFVPPAGELSALFFCTGGWTLGDWTSGSRATADKSANPQTWLFGRKMLRAGNWPR